MRFTRSVLPVAFVFFLTSSLHAQTTARPSVKISGEVTKPLTLYADDLAKMTLVTVPFKDRDNKMHQYKGVPVRDILEQAGATMGRQLRGENLSKYLLVKCADGYEVVFSLAELDSSFTDRNIVLVYEAEGKPLPVAQGPFRVIVPGEKKPARSCLQVNEIVVRYAKE